MSHAPARSYYLALVGAWSGALEVTRPPAGRGWLARLLTPLARLTGRYLFQTTLAATDRGFHHTTRVQKFGLVLLTNPLTVWLSVAGAFLASTYPFLKRYTYLPQVYLGVAFGWGIPMAFAAVQGTVPALAWLLFLGNLLWTTGYDTWYAMVDREDDIRAGSKSTAILFGDADLVAQGVIYAGFFWAMWLVGARAGLGIHYQAALGVSLLLVGVQFWMARRRDRAGCFRAFLANQWVGLAVFVGIAAHYALA